MDKFVYLLALIPFCLIWAWIFSKRKDLRAEVLVMSVMIGVVSVATSYFWWTVDWWQPLTFTGTKVGIEDFIMGFTSGGIMAALYEVVFKKSAYRRKLHHHISGGLTILFLLAQTMMLLFWGIGLTSFWASTYALIFTAVVMLFIRRDLILNSFLSGILMALVSVLFYAVILVISPEWIQDTYLSGLSGFAVYTIPMEEFIFWFLAGLVFGPFYEYWQGERLRSRK